MGEGYSGDHAGSGENSAGFDVFPDWDSALSYSVNCAVANGYAERVVQRAAARLSLGLLGSDRDVCVSRAGRLLVEGLLRGDVFEPTLDHAGECELVFCWVASCVRDVLGLYAARLINCLVAPPGFGKSLENMLGEDVYLNRARMYVLESGEFTSTARWISAAHCTMISVLGIFGICPMGRMWVVWTMR